MHNLAGLCLSFMGQPENALEAFDRALALNEGYVEAHLNRAITLNELNRYDEARKSFERASHYENATGGRLPAAVTAKIANAHASVGGLYQDAGAYKAIRLACGVDPRGASLAHQGAGKHLRSAWIVINRELPPERHSLLALTRGLDAPDAVIEDAAFLNPDYLASRYPDAANGLPDEAYTEKLATAKLDAAHRIASWEVAHRGRGRWRLSGFAPAQADRRGHRPGQPTSSAPTTAIRTVI